MGQTVDVLEPGRAKTGQFVKGHTVKSPGRPPKPRVDYHTILRECVTEEEHRAIIRRAIVDAKNGSRHAREWIYKHLISPFPRLTLLDFTVAQRSEPELDSDVAVDNDYADAAYRELLNVCQTEAELDVAIRLANAIATRRLESREESAKS